MCCCAGAVSQMKRWNVGIPGIQPKARVGPGLGLGIRRRRVLCVRCEGGTGAFQRALPPSANRTYRLCCARAVLALPRLVHQPPWRLERRVVVGRRCGSRRGRAAVAWGVRNRPRRVLRAGVLLPLPSASFCILSELRPVSHLRGVLDPHALGVNAHDHRLPPVHLRSKRSARTHPCPTVRREARERASQAPPPATCHAEERTSLICSMLVVPVRCRVRRYSSATSTASLPIDTLSAPDLRAHTHTHTHTHSCCW